jgi:hypothetical protein
MMGRGTGSSSDGAAQRHALRGSRRGPGRFLTDADYAAARLRAWGRLGIHPTLTAETIDGFLMLPGSQRDRSERLELIAARLVNDPLYALSGRVPDSWTWALQSDAAQTWMRQHLVQQLAAADLNIVRAGTPPTFADVAEVHVALLSAHGDGPRQARQASASWVQQIESPVNGQLGEALKIRDAISAAGAEDPAVDAAVDRMLDEQRAESWQSLIVLPHLTAGAARSWLAPDGGQLPPGEHASRIEALTEHIVSAPHLATDPNDSLASAHLRLGEHIRAVVPQVDDVYRSHIQRSLDYFSESGFATRADDEPVSLLTLWSMHHHMMRLDDDDGLPAADVLAVRHSVAEWVSEQNYSDPDDATIDMLGKLTWPMGHDTDEGALAVLEAVSVPLARHAAAAPRNQRAARFNGWSAEQTQEFIAATIAGNADSRGVFANFDHQSGVMLLLAGLPAAPRRGDRILAMLAGHGISEQDIGADTVAKIRRARDAGMQQIARRLLGDGVDPGDHASVIRALRTV